MSIDTYVPTLTDHERRQRHNKPLEITPEPGKLSIGDLINTYIKAGITSVSKLARDADLSEKCIRNLRKNNCDNQKSVNTETAASVARALGIDDPYDILWPCAFGDKGRPHESTGSLPIINPDEVRRDADDPTVHYRRIDGRWRPFCNDCYQPMYVRKHRLTCDNCSPE